MNLEEFIIENGKGKYPSRRLCSGDIEYLLYEAIEEIDRLRTELAELKEVSESYKKIINNHISNCGPCSSALNEALSKSNMSILARDTISKEVANQAAREAEEVRKQQ